MVLIAGHDGGTGASPLTAIKHAGLPWELGLAETQQTLLASRLRDRIRVQVDGQLKTGRDVAIAALLGAEEFGFGTTVLVALGCVMARQCHLNTCPVGVATQDPRLRARFAGKPEHVERFMRFIAQDLREHMARLGFRTVDEMVGRSDRLDVEPAVNHWKAKGLDFGGILAPPPAPAPGGGGTGFQPVNHGQDAHATSWASPGRSPAAIRCTRPQEHDLVSRLDWQLIEQARPALEEKKPVRIALAIRNVHRTVGATLSGEIVRRYGPRGLPDETIQLECRGSAGQSLGAFLAPGVTIRVEGDANDYVGKGLSGGRIIIRPPAAARFQAHENIVIGNVALYGATGGEAFFAGLAGERFAVRNSGAAAVVEGVGDHGCEYMTGGVVVVLGPVGYNFAAGMSGGIAYVYDEAELFGSRANLDMVDLESVWTPADQAQLRGLIEKHHQFTASRRARAILDDWEAQAPLFVKVVPTDYRKVLERMRQRADVDAETVSATEEVYGHG
jgi:glutamate synthase domain-containing protein 3